MINLALLTPWQQLLWIVCAVILIVPILAAGVTTVIRGYFNAKENHMGKVAKALAEAFGKLGEGATRKVEEQLKKVKKDDTAQ